MLIRLFTRTNTVASACVVVRVEWLKSDMVPVVAVVVVVMVVMVVMVVVR